MRLSTVLFLSLSTLWGCDTAPSDAPITSVRAEERATKQNEYLRALRQQEPAWRQLSDEEQELRRDHLKSQILAGVQ